MALRHATSNAHRIKVSEPQKLAGRRPQCRPARPPAIYGPENVSATVIDDMVPKGHYTQTTVRPPHCRAAALRRRIRRGTQIPNHNMTHRIKAFCRRVEVVVFRLVSKVDRTRTNCSRTMVYIFAMCIHTPTF